jgi:hypothetical protein
MHRLFLVVSLVLFVSACDQPPGLPPPTSHPPELGALTISPSEVNIGELDPGSISEGGVTFTVDMRAGIRSTGGGIEEVRYTIRRPDRQQGGILTTGNLSPDGDGYGGTAMVTLPAGAVGNYQVVVTARGVDGSLSNEAAAMLRYRAEGSAPVIENVEASPNPLTPPATLTIIVTASDPDGLENIAAVYGLTPAGSQFELFDDGESFGDEVAGDGRFTARFDVPSATPGSQTFRFWAVDRIGLESEVVEYDVVIQ